MLKKDITYEDYNGQTVTESFYFNFTKLELMEKDLEYGGLQEVITKLTQTSDAKQAYALFKEVILDAYGVKSDDGRRFVKSPQIRQDFENSPALSELIFEFIEQPQKGAAFMEATLPANLVAEIQKAKVEERKSESDESPLERQLAKSAELKFEDYTEAELLALSQEEFQALLPKNPAEMTKNQLVLAMRRKNTEG